MKLYDLTIEQALIGLKNKEFSATEITESYLERMNKFHKLNAFITETSDRALSNAKESDERIKNNSARALEGIPIGMKDLFATKGIKTTAGSEYLKNFIPEYESTVSDRLKESGTILLGKTNMDEFACGSSGKSSYFGPAVNPWKSELKLMAGGSSSGSASAVAAGLVMGTTATDTGGSTRFPAAITGTIGFKPSYGLCSRFGCIAYSSSLDTPSFITRTVADSALMFDVVKGVDSFDSTCYQKNLPASYPELNNIDVRGLKIGIIKELMEKPICDDARKLFESHIKNLKDKGAEIIDLSLDIIPIALQAYAIITAAEVSSNLARYDGVRYGERENGNTLDEMYSNTRTKNFGLDIKRKILVGMTVLANDKYEDYFVQAAKVRKILCNKFNEMFSKCDFIIAPVSAKPASPLNEEISSVDMQSLDFFVLPMNLAGLPACSIPSGLTSDGLPLGIQVVGNRYDDNRVLALSNIVEKYSRENGFDNKPSFIIGE